MADKEIYVGTVGPHLIDTTDALLSDPGQVATKSDLPVLASTVSNETTWGISPNAGSSVNASKADHTHGSPADIRSNVAGHTIILAKLTTGGTNGSITWGAGGIITAYVDPT